MDEDDIAEDVHITDEHTLEDAWLVIEDLQKENLLIAGQLDKWRFWFTIIAEALLAGIVGIILAELFFGHHG